jgi:PAS domain S-box-containing protein
LGVLITSGNAENPTVLYQNKRFTEISGYEPHEMLGKNPKIMRGPLTDRQVMIRLKDASRRGKQFIGSTFDYRKSGESFPICWTVFPLKLKEEKCFIALIEDMSDFEGDPLKKILVIEKNARLMSVEMLNRIQLATEMMKTSSKEEMEELSLMIQTAVELIKELEKIVEYSMSLMIAEQETAESSFSTNNNSSFT